MKVAIYSRVIEEDYLQEVQNLFNELAKHKIEPIIVQSYFEQIISLVHLSNNISTFSDSADLDDSIDCIISLGGDGTLLDTVTLVRNKNIPVLGINFGRLGFLASIGPEEVANAVKALARRSFVIDKRALVHLDANLPLFGDVPYALNEFVIHKQDIAPMVKIHTYLNGELLNTYWADGLILSTPTGSTGYSL